MEGDVHQLVDHLFRREAGRMVAGLTRIFGPAHLDLAEDVVQEALLQALRTWPFRGLPDNPAGWLVQVAKNRALDALRRNASLASKEEDIRTWAAARDQEEMQMDDQLRLIFICCQSAVPAEARVALTLKTVGGFGVPEIARAFGQAKNWLLKLHESLQDGVLESHAIPESALSCSKVETTMSSSDAAWSSMGSWNAI